VGYFSGIYRAKKKKNGIEWLCGEGGGTAMERTAMQWSGIISYTDHEGVGVFRDATYYWVSLK
jgi:hypothetical protein